MKRANATMPGLVWESMRSALRRGRAAPVHVASFPDAPGEDDDFRQAAFTLAVIALSATFATRVGLDVRRASLVFGAVFPMPHSEREKVSRLFQRAAADPLGPIHYARQIVGLFAHRPALLTQVLERLFMLAAADGRLDDARLKALTELADVFGVSDAAFRAIRRRHVATDAPDPYAILGVTHHVNDDELRRAYRRLLREYHPDGLAAYGLSKGDIAFAAEKTAQINQAFDMVARRRGLK